MSRTAVITRAFHFDTRGAMHGRRGVDIGDQLAANLAGRIVEGVDVDVIATVQQFLGLVFIQHDLAKNDATLGWGACGQVLAGGKKVVNRGGRLGDGRRSMNVGRNGDTVQVGEQCPRPQRAG